MKEGNCKIGADKQRTLLRNTTQCIDLPQFYFVKEIWKRYTGPKPMGGGGWVGRSALPADHLSENFALLSEFLCSK